MGISKKAVAAATWATSLAVVAGGGMAWSNVQQAAPAVAEPVNVCVRVSTQAIRLETDAKPCKLTAPKYTQETRVSLAPADAVNALGSRLDAVESTNAQQDTRITQQGNKIDQQATAITQQADTIDRLDSRLTAVENLQGELVASPVIVNLYEARVEITGRELKPGTSVRIFYRIGGSEKSAALATVAPDGTITTQNGFTGAYCLFTNLYVTGTSNLDMPVKSNVIDKFPGC